MKGGRALCGFGVSGLLGLAGALGPMASGCGDDPTIVELTVVETVPVDFDDMQGGITEGATVELDDLRDEPAYVEAVASLECGTVNKATSFIEAEALQVGAGATVVDYQVGVAPKGSTSYVPLVRFNGSVTAGDKIALNDARVTIDAAGLAQVSQIVRSATPAMTLQVQATVPGELQDMQLALSLAIDFSSDAQGCP